MTFFATNLGNALTVTSLGNAFAATNLGMPLLLLI